MNNLAIKELMRSKEEQKILTGKISGIENEYYKLRNTSIPCAIVWYEDTKILIPVTHLGTHKQNKSTIRGMLSAEIDYIVIEIDEVANIAIASRELAMNLKSKLELPKLEINNTVKVRIISVGVKRIVVELYGKEVTINAEELQHTYIVNCKDIYKCGEYLKVKIKKIDIEKGIFELTSKCFLENPYNNIRKYIIEYGEYTGKVIGFPRNSSGIIVQLDKTNVTCLVRVPAKFNNYPHYMDNVLVKITEIKAEKKFLYGYLMRII